MIVFLTQTLHFFPMKLDPSEQVYQVFKTVGIGPVLIREGLKCLVTIRRLVCDVLLLLHR
jgi:hypothetical protein